jgi:hypothetical protein
MPKRKPPQNPPPIFEVEWQDIVVTTTGWQSNKLNKPDIEICRTVGYVVFNDGKNVVLVSSWSIDEQITKSTIPIGCVRSIVEWKK